MGEDKITAEQVNKRTLREICIKAEHKERNDESFEKSVHRIKEDGNYQCFIFGCKNEKLQVHHIEEFSNANTCNFDKLKNFLLKFDPYGYGNLMKNLPLTSIDDVRNLMVLCQEHHNNINEKENNGTGIHNISFPSFVAQCVCNDDENPVPQENESTQQVLDRVK